MSKFDSQHDQSTVNGVAALQSTVRGVLNAGASNGLVDAELATRVSLESDSLMVGEFDQVLDRKAALEQALVAEASANGDIAVYGKEGIKVATEAAAYASIAASGLTAHLRKDPFAVPAAPQGATVITNYLGAASHPRIAQEAYDEREIRNSVISSTVLNYRAARQNAFGEMFFQTVILAPDQTGYHMFLEQVNVMKEVRRNTNGTYNRFFNRVNLVKAAIDPTILDMSETDVVPVVRAGDNEHVFVDPAKVPAVKHTLNGVTFDTAPLAFGVDVDLLGVSQNEALLRTGVLDHTDALDPALSLTALYFEVGSDVIKFDNLSYLTTSNFVPAPQGDSRAMILNFNSQNFPLSKVTTKIDGADLTGDLAAIKANGWVVRVKMAVNGTVNLQDAGHSAQATSVAVTSITDKDGVAVDMSAGQGKAIVDAIAKGSLLGYDLKCRRTNSNKRTRGLLLDMSSYSILYTVPLHGPISTNRPLATGDEHSQTDLTALITATRYYTSISAVTALFNIRNLLKQYAFDRKMGSDLDTEYLGISRKLVQPHYEEAVVNVAKVVASLKSEDRPLQVQAVLVNKLRDMVFRAWYASGLGVAADAVFAGEAPTPVVKIGTDPVIARYLQVAGDLRTIGGKFEVQIETSWDARMQGKLFVAFGYNMSEGESAYHPLNFGMMLWKPEVVIAAPIYRQGATNKELTVQPSFLHVCNTPILMHLEVQNLEQAAVDMIAINTRVAP